MPTDPLLPLLEAITQLSTQVVFLILLGRFAVFLLWVLFAVDLLSILLAALMRRFAEHHLTIRPMMEVLGRLPPYNRTDRNAVFATFLRGLDASRVAPTLESSSPSDP